MRSRSPIVIKLLLEAQADLSIRSKEGLPVDIADEETKAILLGKSKYLIFSQLFGTWANLTIFQVLPISKTSCSLLLLILERWKFHS